MIRKLFGTIALVALVMCLVSSAAWAVPSLINYQGKLTNTSDCVLTGDYEMQFLLYDTEINGTVLWGEQQTVTVDQGLLSVQLGRSLSFPSGLFDNDSLYLEMMIWNPEASSWETLTPRQRITSVAYAIKAGHAVMADSATNAVKADTATKADISNAAKGMRALSSAPATPSIGEVYFNTTSKMAFIWDGSQWNEYRGPKGDKGDTGTQGPPGPVAGSNEQFIYNNGGSAAGANVYYNNQTGNVGIGAPGADGGFKLYINGGGIDTQLLLSAGGDNYVGFKAWNSLRRWIWQITPSWDTPAGRFRLYDAVGTSEYISVLTNGNVGIGTNNPSYKLHVIGDAKANHWYTSSDSRLKENITPLTDAIEKVSALRGIYFNLKSESPSKREVGVIAQEVEAVLPEVVSTDAQGYKSVDYSKLTPLLIEATKALQAQIERQQAQIEDLQSRIKALESR